MGGKAGQGPWQNHSPMNMDNFNNSMSGFNMFSTGPGMDQYKAQQAALMDTSGRMGDVSASMSDLSGQYNPLIAQSAALGQGGWDRFTQGQMGQFDVLGNQRQQATLSQMARQGLTGSAAASSLDQQGWQTAMQKQALSGQLGQAGLQFGSQQLGQQAQMRGQQGQIQGAAGALLGQSQQGYMDASKITDSMGQMLLAGPASQTAFMGAYNQGGSFGPKGGGGSLKDSGWGTGGTLGDLASGLFSGGPKIGGHKLW